MITITLAGIKGGTGKSTLAYTLAAWLSIKYKVLLLDVDEQGTTMRFINKRKQTLEDNIGFTPMHLIGEVAIINTVTAVAKDYDYIVIDSGSRDTTSQRAAIALATVVLYPFPPSSSELWTTDQVVEVLRDIRDTKWKKLRKKIHAFSFLNKAHWPVDTTEDPPKDAEDNISAAEYLREWNKDIEFVDSKIVSRKAFEKSTNIGLTVIERKGRDYTKAAEEVNRLFKLILKKIHSYEHKAKA